MDTNSTTTRGGIPNERATRDTKDLQDQMDAAAEVFGKEFAVFVDSLEIEEVQAVARAIDLIQKHRSTAGYKRTCQQLFKQRDQI